MKSNNTLSLMHYTNCMEQYQVAYTRALVAAAGLNIGKPEVDDDGIDITISSKSTRSKKNHRITPAIAAQLKATSDLSIENGVVSYPLAISNYHQLIGSCCTPRYLFILQVPSIDCNDWVKQEDASLLLHGTCYWVSLEHELESTNKSSVTVKVSDKQVLTPAILYELLVRAAGGQND